MEHLQASEGENEGSVVEGEVWQTLRRACLYPACCGTVLCCSYSTS
jgi:hypothetical protein